VIVTGCFDWLHSGHVRFFEETSELGDLYVVVGHDENIKLLKGAGHPMFSQDERRYMVQSVCCVKQALISTGHGWMDAKPAGTNLKLDLHQWEVVLALYASALWRKPVEIPFDPPDDLFPQLAQALR
jgi:cytidyltransferase-like protein